MAGSPKKSPKKESPLPGEKDVAKNLLHPNSAIKDEQLQIPNGNSSKVMDGPDEFIPPDGGWGWVVCLAAFWTNGTVFGILNTFGILYVKMIDEFGKGDDDIAFKCSWIGALQISMTFFLSPVASILVDRFGIRITGCVGACVATAGMVASSFVHNLELLYLTYGLLLGIGSSIIYNPSLVILGHYFKKHLGIVNGLVSFGSAVFTIVLPFMLKELLVSVGLRNTMRVLAGLICLLIPASLTWKPLFENRHTELDHYLSTDSMSKKVSGCCRFASKFLNVSIWKVKGYRIWALSLPIAFLGYFVPFVHLVNHTNQVFPGSNGEILVMCIGATSGVSRLVFGKVADLPNVNRIRMQQASFVILGIATACIPFAGRFEVLIFLTLIMGIADGCFICLLGPIAFDLLGPSGAAQGIGCLLGICSFPMTAGPPLAGLAFDLMGTYKLVFLAAGAPPLLAAILLFLIPAQPQAEEAVNLVGTHVAMSRTDLDKVGLEESIHGSKNPIYRLKAEEGIDMRLARSVGSLHNANMNGSATYTPKANRRVQSLTHLADPRNGPTAFRQTDSLTEKEFPVDTRNGNVSIA